MRKGAARNMQRISLKVTAGIAPPERGAKQAPYYKQVHALELHRLARIRYTFELEQQIQRTLADGENAGLLRERLAGVRNGTIDPPRYADARVTGRRPVSETQRHERPRSEKHRERRLYASERQVGADLADLSKGKLTLTGVATVKGLLDRFDIGFVAASLALTAEFIDKVTASSVYALAPSLSTADGLLLAEVLEQRAYEREQTESDTVTSADPSETPAPAPKPTPAPQQFISVDSITGAEYLTLRAHGWTISGARMYPPAGWEPPKPSRSVEPSTALPPSTPQGNQDPAMETPPAQRETIITKVVAPLNERALLDVQTTPGKMRRTLSLPGRTALNGVDRENG